MINVLTTELPNVRIIQPYVYDDFRGEYVEIWNETEYKDKVGNIKFVQDDISVSRQHVLRGLHGDGETWKLVSCLSGAFYLVVLNYDRDSDHFGKWISVTLSDKNRKQVLIPPKHANGHLVLSEKAIFHYKQNTYYNPKGQFTILWNDPKFNIWWPIKRPIISQRDEFGHFID
jgi:dTDP-4-dehydrorhamnose 3,5-epimerase